MLFMTVLVIGQKPSGQVLLNPHGLNTQWLCASTLMPGSHVLVPGFPLSTVSWLSVWDRLSFAVLTGILAAVTLLSVMLECYTSPSVLFPNSILPSPCSFSYTFWNSSPNESKGCMSSCLWIMQWDAFPLRWITQIQPSLLINSIR